MEQRIREVFNSSAEKYDSQRRELIPQFYLFYGTAIEVMEMRKLKGKVLDLGAGTGLLTQYALTKYKDAEYILIDIADEMLSVAKKSKNISFKVYDYRKGFNGEIYDSIISAMSIHHLDYNEKRELYKNIYNALPNGGVFVNADQVKGEDDKSEKIVKGYQLNYIENCKLSRDEKDKTYDRIKLDKMDKISDQIQMLREAGFRSVDIYYKYYNYIVFKAIK